MKKITDKWKGMRVTLNYFGESNNRFGLKKKKVIFEEDKIQSLSDLRRTSNFKLEKFKKNKLGLDYMVNNAHKRYHNNNNFLLIKINDFEKTKNFNFFNYFRNIKYFNRVNSYKRIMSSSHISANNNMTNNHSKFEESDLKEKKNVVKKVNQISSVNLEKNKKKKEFKISKIDINKIISNYIQEYNDDIQKFNQKNRTINSKMLVQNHFILNSKLMQKNISKSSINKTKKNINIISKKNVDNYKRNNCKSSINRTSNYISFRESANKINTDRLSQKIFNIKSTLENKLNIGAAITISKKTFFYNNANSKQKKEKSQLILKKNNSSIDASTNTDFYKKKKII